MVYKVNIKKKLNILKLCLNKIDLLIPGGEFFLFLRTVSSFLS